LAVVCAEYGIDIAHMLNGNSGDLAETDQKETLEHAFGDGMVCDPLHAFACHVVLGTRSPLM